MEHVHVAVPFSRAQHLQPDLEARVVVRVVRRLKVALRQDQVRARLDRVQGQPADARERRSDDFVDTPVL